MLHRETRNHASPAVLAVAEIIPEARTKPETRDALRRSIAAHPELDPVREARCIVAYCQDHGLPSDWWAPSLWWWMEQQASTKIAVEAGDAAVAAGEAPW